MIHRAPGLRPDQLNTYLAALGLIRAVCEQADQETVCWWDNGTFVMDTALDDLADFLVHDYRPSPILSPWNSGSGYGEADKSQRQALERILSSDSPRLQSFIRTHAAIQRVLADAPADKALLVQRLRNQVPDEALPWLDAAVVLTNDDSAPTKRRAIFPPLLGSGGNDGRFDFSTNFHQRLAEALPELGARESASKQWAEAMLSGDSSQLSKATVGQFDPLAAGGPRASAFSDSESLVNPWTFILMIEGLLFFASSPSRRLGETTSRAAMPFTVNADPAGPLPGGAAENARGELWAPLWARPLTIRDIAHLFSSAKATWDGRTANQAAQMYAALHSRGTDRRISGLIRYAFLQRNGLAFTAVKLDELAVEDRSAVRLAVPIQRRAQTFRNAIRDPSARGLMAARAYDAAYLTFCRNVDARSLLTLLACELDLETTAAAAQADRERISRTNRKPAAADVVPVILDELKASPELRLASSLASGFLRYGGHQLSLADLFVGQPPQRTGESWQEAVITGFGYLDPAGSLSELLAWRATHWDESASSTTGVRTMDFYAMRPLWSDAHLWVQGQLDSRRLQQDLKAMMALDWRSDGRPPSTLPRFDASDAPGCLPSPALAILHPFAGGLVFDPASVGSETSRAHGLDPNWPIRLAYGGRHGLTGVLQEATSVMNRSVVGWRQLRSVQCAVPESTIEGRRLAAALWAPASTTALSYIAILEDISPDV
jgi:CRISPR-associated protein Csx17